MQIKSNKMQTFNVAVVKNLFSSVYVIGTLCLDECFLFYFTTEMHFFFNHHVLFLKQAFWKKSVCYIISITTVQY